MMRHTKATEHIVRTEFQKLLRADYQDDFDDVPLADLGIDSLDFFEKILFLEDEFGISIRISELDNKVTLSDILDTLQVKSE